MKPNILFILTDQQRFDCAGFAGNRQIQTPHLDAIAQGGVTFQNAFCSFPVCTPSRYSLLSGLAVHQHGGANNKCTLLPHLPTFPKTLREAGYRNRAIGKMHFTPTYLDAGFDALELCEQDGDGRWEDDYHRELRENGLADLLDIQDQRSEFRARAPQEYWATLGAQVCDLPEEWHSTTWIGNRALKALESWDASGGHLLMASFVKPHHPFDPPARWAEKYDPETIELLPGYTSQLSPVDAGFQGYFPNDEWDEAALKRATAFYYASISQLDHQVGRLIENLKARGLYDDTLIVFTSDHGDYMGFHHMMLKSGPMYDPLLRVPLLIKFPGNARGGEKSAVLTPNTDLAPTILAQAGLGVPAPMRGLDLSDAQAQRPLVFAQAMGRRWMARSLTHKLLLGPNPHDNAFFDLQNDPMEECDLWHEPQHQAQIAEFRRALGDWLMLDSPIPIALDESAPQIAGAPDPENRAAMVAYFEEKWAQNAGKQST